MTASKKGLSCYSKVSGENRKWTALQGRTFLSCELYDLPLYWNNVKSELINIKYTEEVLIWHEVTAVSLHCLLLAAPETVLMRRKYLF